MRRVICLLLSLAALSIVLGAQAFPSSKLAWDQQGSSLAEVQVFTYKSYADGGTTGTALTGVTCGGTTSPYQCEVAYPAFTPGSHTLQLTAGNAAGESTKSVVFSFSFVVVPQAPTSLHIK